MTWDFTIKITDIIMIGAIVIGPILAVQITEYLRNLKDIRDRKVYIFRTLMATRSAPLLGVHIEALNLVELEFHSNKAQDRRVVDTWRLYLTHLSDQRYPKETWSTRKDELLIDFLHEMSLALGYSYDKSQIKSGAYYPSGYQESDFDHYETRKLWLEVLKGKRPLPMLARIVTDNQDTFPVAEPIDNKEIT